VLNLDAVANGSISFTALDQFGTAFNNTFALSGFLGLARRRRHRMPA
jgi:hypothetical protein